MKKKLKNIAIIPARIGSKRIKKKNIKKFLNKPIIYWTLKKLKESKLFDKIFISTDSQEITKTIKKFGFYNIIKRGNSLSNDKVGINPVIKNAINQISKKYILENVCCVFACNPFLEKKELKKSFKILKLNNNSFIFPLVKYSHPIERAFFFIKKKFIKRVTKTKINEKTQDFKNYYYDAGSFYLAKKKTWLNDNRKNLIGMPISWWKSVDIDTLEDWKKAETLYRVLK